MRERASFVLAIAAWALSPLDWLLLLAVLGGISKMVLPLAMGSTQSVLYQKNGHGPIRKVI
jgi:hypothetical protein